MLCQQCHKNLATVRYAEVVDGKVTDLHLCAECLAQHQEKEEAGFALSGPVTSARSTTPPRVERTRVKIRVCKTCGTQLTQVVDSATVGCSACYNAFAQIIQPIVTNIHGGGRHMGKSPRVDDARTILRSNLQTKRSLLRSALNSENYERAAILRDEIRQLEEQLSGAGKG